MKILKLAVASAIVLLVVGGCIPMDYHEHVCFHCRCRHDVGTILGIPYTSYAPTGMTRWYAERFPSHIHQWMHLGHVRTVGFGGMVESSVGGRSMMMNPFWAASEQEQFDFLKSATAVEAYLLTSHLAEHRQREAVNLVLSKQMPPRVICDGVVNSASCETPVVPRSAAISGEGANGGRTFCSIRCRDQFRDR